MDEYIDKEAFKHKYLCCGYLEEISENEFDNFPAADVAPVVHGYWDNSGRCKFFDGHIAIRCSICGASITEKEYKNFVWNFCPVCGAKMDGDNTI